MERKGQGRVRVMGMGLAGEWMAVVRECQGHERRQDEARP